MKAGQTIRILLMIIVLAMICQACADEGAETVRPAYFAGSWYPGSAGSLAGKLSELLAKAPVAEIKGKPIAVSAPQAGYSYSAPAAAAGYRCLQGHSYKRVIVMAFNHRYAGAYQGVDVPAKLTAYQTPLGKVPIDRKVVDKLLAEAVFKSNAGMHSGEHSLELQLPFLQKVLKDFKLVPMLVGRMSNADYTSAAKAIIPWLDDETLLVASSDFTHYGPMYGYEPFKEDVPDKLAELADKASAPLLKCDFDGFADHISKTRDSICGRGPILLLLRILSMEGGATGVRTAYDTSGNIGGSWTNSVSYLSFVFTERPGTLTGPQRSKLLQIARQTVDSYIKGQGLGKVDTAGLPEALRKQGACFVTLENHGRLRGCIGTMTATEPLHKAVVHYAVEACRDSRFVGNPVTAVELGQINVEISYLTPMQRIKDTNEIIIGRHGLMLGLGRRRGVLLPQVASERGWTRGQFLTQLCYKAGLPDNSWKQPGAELYSFEAEVFSEPEPTTTRPAGHR